MAELKQTLEEKLQRELLSEAASPGSPAGIEMMSLNPEAEEESPRETKEESYQEALARYKKLGLVPISPRRTAGFTAYYVLHKLESIDTELETAYRELLLNSEWAKNFYEGLIRKDVSSQEAIIDLVCKISLKTARWVEQIVPLKKTAFRNGDAESDRLSKQLQALLTSIRKGDKEAIVSMSKELQISDIDLDKDDAKLVKAFTL